jgi:hypothetical protein
LIFYLSLCLSLIEIKTRRGREDWKSRGLKSEVEEFNSFPTLKKNMHEGSEVASFRRDKFAFHSF